jgi:threonyl-tRNA synthetase
VVTPHIAKEIMYQTSGHLPYYADSMFPPMEIDGTKYYLRGMNCPHHHKVFDAEPKSYKDLPVRYAEFGTVYRYEQAGELHGLTRVRGFTQDDAHLFCRPDQVKEEFIKVIDLVLYVFKTLDFQDYTAQISLRDKDNRAKYIGSDENWEKAEQAIIEAASERNLRTIIEYGEAAFYGPKLDFMVKDAIGRKWQLGTIQVDYNLPERFELEYKGSDNQMHRPVMIHRAPFGSMERFVAVLTEHCAGSYPLWLTPDQVILLPISENYTEYAKNVAQLLNNSDIRAFVDERNETAGKKIREAELKKVPYMLIVGEKEQESGTVSVRQHGGNDLGAMSTEDFVKHITTEVNDQLNKNEY